MRILVIGAGGAGGYFAARWAQAGLDVTVVARGAHLDAIRSGGLRLHSPLGDVAVEVRAVERAGEVSDVDVIVVATKTWQLSALGDDLASVAGPGTVVFGLQNGVEAAGTLASFAPKARVVGGTCRIVSFIEAPGVVRHAGIDPVLTLGERGGGAGESLRSAVDALNDAPGLEVELSHDIDGALWSKFLFFAPLSGLGSVTRAPFGVLRSVADTRALLIRALEEVFELAGAVGVGLPADAVERTLRFIDGLPPAGTSSLQRDFRDRVRTELDALAGAVVRLGAAAGVDVPVHRMVYAALLPLELEARGELEWPEGG